MILDVSVKIHAHTFRLSVFGYKGKEKVVWHDCGIFTASWIEDQALLSIKHLLSQPMIIARLLKVLNHTRLCESFDRASLQGM